MINRFMQKNYIRNNNYIFHTQKYSNSVLPYMKQQQFMYYDITSVDIYYWCHAENRKEIFSTKHFLSL